MRYSVALPVLALMATLLFGCGRASSPPSSAAPAGGGPAGQGDDTTAILKAITEAAAAGSNTTASGSNNGTLQVGSHSLKTTMDVPVSKVMQGEKASLSFQGRNLVIEFDKGRVLLDDMEQAKLPTGTKVVDVQFVGGKLSVTADGTTVTMPDASK